MAYYNTCPFCGANLDPGESCDCLREKERRRHERGQALAVESSGQFYIRGITNEQNVRTAI